MIQAFLDIYINKIKLYTYIKYYTKIIKAALFIVKIRNEPNIDLWILYANIYFAPPNTEAHNKIIFIQKK